jgi:tetratricopeptide (TPR) repeat protein
MEHVRFFYQLFSESKQFKVFSYCKNCNSSNCYVSCAKITQVEKVGKNRMIFENFKILKNMKKQDEYYYDAMELLDMGEVGACEALKLLNKALKLDENYAQTYIGFICAYGNLGKEKEYEKAVKAAYEKTLKKFQKWPKRMEGGVMENRAYMRAIQYMAEWHWDNGEDEKAIELFRLLLKLNPGDNQGVRYEIAGLYAGVNGDDINDMFDEGNANQNWDNLEILVEEQNKKHKFWKPQKY